MFVAYFELYADARDAEEAIYHTFHERGTITRVAPWFMFHVQTSHPHRDLISLLNDSGFMINRHAMEPVWPYRRRRN